MKRSYPLRFTSLLCLLSLLSGCFWKPGLPLFSHKRQKESLPLPSMPHKTIKQMTVEEAEEAARYYKNTNQDLLIAAYRHIIAKSKEPDVTAHYSMQLADFYLENNNREEAKKLYRKLITLYPGHKNIERARYREFLAHFMGELAPERDQTITTTTIKMGRDYLRDFPNMHDACNQVKEMIISSYYRLLAHELFIIEFYLNKFYLTFQETTLQAVSKRINGLRTKLIPGLQEFLPAAETLQSLLELPEGVMESLTSLEGREQCAQMLTEKMDCLSRFLRTHGAVEAIDLTAAQLRNRF